MLQRVMFLKSKKRAAYYGCHRFYQQFSYAMSISHRHSSNEPVLIYDVTSPLAIPERSNMRNDLNIKKIGIARLFSTDNRRPLEDDEPQMSIIQKDVVLTDDKVDGKEYMQKYHQFLNSQNLKYKSLLLDLGSEE